MKPLKAGNYQVPFEIVRCDTLADTAPLNANQTYNFDVSSGGNVTPV